MVEEPFFNYFLKNCIDPEKDEEYKKEYKDYAD